MVEAGHDGVIVNISSISRAGNMGQSNYAAAKAGVHALTVTWGKRVGTLRGAHRYRRAWLYRNRDDGLDASRYVRKNRI